MTLTLSFFTLNCWGIPFLSKDVPARMNAIATFLAQSTFDVVCLQEVWSNSDYELIKSKVQENLPFSHYFHSGVIGSGLCIFSKHQITDSLFHQWAVNGYVHKIQHGDWFGGKGVGLCRIMVGDQAVNVYTAHLHAEYDRQNDEYLAHRVVQAFDTAQFIKLSSYPGEISLVAGDLNTEPTDNAFHVIKHVTGLRDCQDSSKDELMTNEAVGNTYRMMTAPSADAPGKRIDYLLYRPSQGMSVQVKEFAYGVPNKVPGTEMSYSDHEALYAVLKIDCTKDHDDNSGKAKTMRIHSVPIKMEERELSKSALETATVVCEKALQQLKSQQWRYGCYLLVTLATLVVVHVLLPRVLPDFVAYLSPVLHVLLLMFLVFSVFMATIWHMMEFNGIQAGVLGMQLTLNKLKSG